MTKKIKIVLVNVLLFFLFIFLLEVGIWAWENEDLKRRNDSYRAMGLLKFHPGIKPAEIKLQYFPNPEENWGRAPEGLDFKGKPVAFFGCSFTYGLNLKPEEPITEHILLGVFNKCCTKQGMKNCMKKFLNQNMLFLLICMTILEDCI